MLPPSEPSRAQLLPNHTKWLNKHLFQILLRKIAEFRDARCGIQDLPQQKTKGLSYTPLDGDCEQNDNLEGKLYVA